uniref:Lymphoid-restricted membrane protein n=1 Tax=Callorhinchus milii TaxID=7868 RepID=A0A4W3H8E8_CALMI
MSPGSEQWPERERQVSTMDTPHSGHGSLKMKNVSHHKTTQEKSGETGDNADIPCDPKTVADVRVADSEESEEDSTSDDSLSDAQKDISILKRLGLHREFLTDKEVESAFIHLSLAFKSDTFTLKKRLQVEERARDVAEENIQMELQGCKTILQRLMSVCVDGRRQEILAQLEKSLQILDTSITRVSGRSEVLGAVHQVCLPLLLGVRNHSLEAGGDSRPIILPWSWWILTALTEKPVGVESRRLWARAGVVD